MGLDVLIQPRQEAEDSLRMSTVQDATGNPRAVRRARRRDLGRHAAGAQGTAGLPGVHLQFEGLVDDLHGLGRWVHVGVGRVEIVNLAEKKVTHRG